MTALVDAAQTAVLLVLLAVTVLLWLRSRAVGRELLELRSSDGDCVRKATELAAVTAACSSRVEAVSANVMRIETESTARQVELERALKVDLAAVRRTADAADTALAQVRQELADVGDGMSRATSSASAARDEARRLQAKLERTSDELDERLRALEGRMGDFLHGCDELVRAEVAAQLADSLPMLDDPVET